MDDGRGTVAPSISDLIAESLTQERSGNIGVAFQRAQEALEEAKASEQPEAVAAALACVAHIQFRVGQYDEARILAEEALTHTASESRARADALLLLGLCAAETDDPAAAEDFYHRAIELSRKLAYYRALLRSLHNLSAGVYVPRGQFELSIAADKEAFRLAEGQNMRELAWAPLATMGWVHWVTGHRGQAYTVAKALRRHAPRGSLAEGFYYCLRADLAQDEGDFRSALPLYSSARSIAEAIGDPGLNVLVRLGLSRYYRALPSAIQPNTESEGSPLLWSRGGGNAPAAWDWANDALMIARRTGYRHLQGMALIERGRAAWEIGETAASESDFRTAMETLTPLQAAFDLARAALFLAALLHRRRDAEAEAAWFDAARRIVAGGYAFLVERERSLAFPLLAAHLGSAEPEIDAISATLLDYLERVPPPPLRVLTLGRFEVWQNARLIEKHAWRRRAGELFRLLLVSPHRSLLRDQITDALWPDSPPASTTALFHQATSALRRALEPDLPNKFPSRYLEVDEGRVTLHLPPGSRVDYEAFERHVLDEKWEAALALYRGPLFPDDRYADWAAMPRQRLIHSYIRTALAAARQRLNAGRPQAALEACRSVLAMEPWQEEAVLLGMRASVALNDRAGALRLYLDLEQRLQQEVGIAPQAEVRRFYRSLL
jgi:DNA-binding SARP family transcriptional activator